MQIYEENKICTMKQEQYKHIEKLERLKFILQSKRQVSKKEIKEELNIRESTFFRYKRELENAGFSVYWNGYGYTVGEGKTYFSMKDIRFTEEETTSFIIAEKIIENLSDLSVRKHFLSALTKIKVGLKYPDKKDFLQVLSEKTKTKQIPYFNIERFPHNYLTDIQLAVGRNKTLLISYYVYHRNKFSEREIIPLELFFYRQKWHIKAFCKLKNDYREFRLDRIEKLQTSSTSYNSAKYTLDEYAASKKISTPETPVKIRLNNSIETYFTSLNLCDIKR